MKLLAVRVTHRDDNKAYRNEPVTGVINSSIGHTRTDEGDERLQI